MMSLLVDFSNNIIIPFCAFTAYNIIMPFCKYTIGCTVIGMGVFALDILTILTRHDPHRMRKISNIIGFGVFGGLLCTLWHVLREIYPTLKG